MRELSSTILRPRQTIAFWIGRRAGGRTWFHQSEVAQKCPPDGGRLTPESFVSPYSLAGNFLQMPTGNGARRVTTCGNMTDAGWLGIVAEKGTNGALGELAGFLSRLCPGAARKGAGCSEEASEGEIPACSCLDVGCQRFWHLGNHGWNCSTCHDWIHGFFCGLNL